MAWNLEEHILNHSHKVHNTLNSKRVFDANDSSNQHFTFSIDIAQLISKNCTSQKDIDKKMVDFMDDLVNFEKTYRVQKGLNKKGEKTYRDLTFNFKDDVLLAYHNSASDDTNSNNYSVLPHFHFLGHKSLKCGIGYAYLREAIKEVSEKHGLVFNLNEETGQQSVDSEEAKSFTWFIKRSSDSDFRLQMTNGWIEQALEKFQNHYKQTGNLQYLLKGYIDLEMRAKRLNIEHNLNFNLFLTETQKQSIKTLYSSDKAAIYEMLSDRKNHIARAFLEHSFGFSNIIIDEIEKRTAQKIPKFEIDLNRVGVKIEQKQKAIGDYTKTINFCYEEDLKTALSYSKNEKELALIMKSLGYSEFAFKQKNVLGKRQRVGFTFENKNGKNVTVYFNNIHTDMNAIRAKLVSNSKENTETPEELISKLRGYTPLKVSKSNLTFEEIYDLKSSLDLKDFFIKELDDHVEFKSKGTFILDKGSEILVKKSKKEDLARNVTLLADMVQAKGWTNFKITGSEQFKTAMKAELDKRAAQKELAQEKVKTAALEQTISTLLEKRTDSEILKDLSTLNLKSVNVDEYKKEFMQLYRIRKAALDSRDLKTLLKTYEIEGAETEFEIREKIVNLGKCLSITKNEIIHELGLDMGLKTE
ncbi:MAG: LPD7 domain-containing protein, partial [Sulfurimonas sp.]|nr:LPD7 domain-containing protein [Sulfurimonas sp.]